MLEMGSSKGDWLMNNRLDFFKRITAFLLVLLLVTTMMGDDFFSLATSDEIITEETAEGTDANAEPDDTSVSETVDVVTEPVEGEEPETAEITEEASPVQPELQEASETQVDTQPHVDENGNPIITEEQPIPETPEKTDESNNDEIKTPEPEKIDVIVENDKKDDLAEEDENKEQPAVDGENKEEVIEGEEKDPTKEEVDKDKDKEKPEEENKVCEHKWEYVSNNDGTHKKFCTECDEITDETCEYNEEGVCIHCGYTLEKDELELEYVELEKEVDGVTLVITGWMPEGAEVTVRNVSTEFAEYYLQQLGEGEYQIFKAYDINIYDTDGNKYQPQDDGNAVKITVKNVEEVAEVDNSQVEVLRVNPDDTVSKLYTEVSEEDVSFVSEHFSYHFIGVSDSKYEGYTDTIAVPNGGRLAVSAQGNASKYTEVRSAEMWVYLLESENSYSFTASIYSGNESLAKPTSGTRIATCTVSVTANEDGWLQIIFGDSDNVNPFVYDETKNKYIDPNGYYSVVISGFSGGDYEVRYGVNTSSLDSYIISGNSVQNTNAGVLDLTLNSLDTNPSINSISISSNMGRNIYSATGEAEKYTGEIWYMKGESDKLIATLTNNYSGTVTWSVTAGSSVTVNAGNIEAVSAGVSTVEARYSDSVYATITVYVVSVAMSNSLDGTFVEDYTNTYTGSAQTPYVSVSDGSNTYKSTQSSYVGTVTGSNNTNAGTATLSIPFTTPTHSVSMTFTKTFTIAKKGLTWAGNFASASFNVDINTNTVTAVTGATSGTNDTLTLDRDYTIALTGKTVDSANGKIKYTGIITGIGNYSTEAASNSGEVSVDTSALDISNYITVEWRTTYPDQEYEGKPIEIAKTDWSTYIVFYESGTTTEATWLSVDDVEAVYSNNTAAGEATIAFKVKGYSGQTNSLSFTINQLPIKNDDRFKITVLSPSGADSDAKYLHTGDAITPDNYDYNGTTVDRIKVEFVVDSTTTLTLEKGTDYTVGGYVNNTDVGTATVNIRGKGNFAGTKTANFTIVPNFADDAVIWVNNQSAYKASKGADSGYKTRYTGLDTPIKPSISVRIDGDVVSTSSYDVKYATEINDDYSVKTEMDETKPTPAGNYYVVAVGKGEYAGMYAAARYTVTTVSMSSVTYKLNTSKYTYTGDVISLPREAYTLTYNGKDLVENTDYTFTYNTTDRTNASTNGVSFTINLQGNFTGSKTDSYVIEPLNISDTTIQLEYNSTVYTGLEKKPAITSVVITSTNKTIEASNYTASYGADCISVGTKAVTVTGSNNLTGSKIVNYDITKGNSANFVITVGGSEVTTKNGNKFAEDYKPVYTGNKRTPSVAIKDGSQDLIANEDFLYSYGSNINVVEYNSDNVANNTASYVKITGTGNYEGIDPIIVYFEIQPRSIDASTVSLTEYVKDVTYVDDSTTHKPNYELIDKGSDLKSTLRNKAIDASNYDIKLYDKDGKETTATKAGAGYYAEIIGKNNYTGTIGKEKTEYNIGVDIAGTVIELYNPLTGAQYTPNADGTYDINWIGENKPVHKLKFNSTTYTDSDNVYTVNRVNDGTNAGSEVTVEFTATGTGGFYSSGSHSYTYRINPIDISNAEPAANPAATEGLTYYKDGNAYVFDYTGNPVDVQSDNLSDGKHLDYYYRLTSSVTGVNDLVHQLDANDFEYINSSFGPARGVYSDTIKVKGKGNFTGILTIPGFEIRQTDITNYPVVYAGDTSTTEFKEKIVVSTLQDSYKLKRDKDKYPTTNGFYAYYANGAEIKIDDVIDVYNSVGTKLTAGTDYLISYSGNKNVGTATVTIKGAGNYSGTNTKLEFKIVQLSADENFRVELGSAYYEFTGAQIQPTDVTVYYGDTLLTKDVDYTLAYGTNIVPGTVNTTANTNYVEVNATSGSIFSGSKRVPINIYMNIGASNITRDTTATLPTAISADGLVKVELTAQSYSTSSTPVAKVYYRTSSTGDFVEVAQATGSTENPEQQYTVTSTNDRPGVGTVTVTGNAGGNTKYVFVRGTYTFTEICFLSPLNSDTAHKESAFASLERTEYAYTGSDVKYDGGQGTVKVNVLYGTEGVDYTISEKSSDYTNVGEKTIRVEATADSNYYVAGSYVDLTYRVKYDLNTAKYTLKIGNVETSTASYTGNPIKYTLTITCAGTIVYSAEIDGATTETTGTYVKIKNSDTMTNVGDHGIEISRNPDSSDVMNGPKTIVLTITGKDISGAVITFKNGTAGNDKWYYTGYEIKDIVDKVTLNGAELTKDTDYYLEYDNNISVDETGTKPVVRVIGKGAYSGSVEKNFAIMQKSIGSGTTAASGITVTLGDAHYVGGNIVKPEITVEHTSDSGTVKLVEGTDYTLTRQAEGSDQRATEVSTVKGNTVITGIGNYSGSITKEYQINKLDLQTNSSVKVDQITTEFTGNPVTVDPVITIKDYDGNDVTLKKDADYNLTVTNKAGAEKTSITDMDTYYIKIGGINSCTGTVSVEYKVTPRSLAKNWKNGTGDVSITVEDVETYDGAAEAPVTITDSGVVKQQLENQVDYKVEYRNNTTGAEGAYQKNEDGTLVLDDNGNPIPEDGSPYAIISGMNNYSDTEADSVKVVFNVGKKLSTDFKITDKEGEWLTEFNYNGQSQIPRFNVKSNDETVELVKDTDYVVEVYDTSSNEKDSINAGEKKLVVKGIGKYYGTIEDTYRINPKNITPSYNWTNKYSDTGTSTRRAGITLELKDMATMTTSVSSSLYGTTAYGGYYYVGFDKKYATDGFKPTPILTDVDLGTTLEEGVDYIIGTKDVYGTIIDGNKNNKAASVITDTTVQLAEVQISLQGNYVSPSSVFTIYYIITPSDMNVDSFKVQFVDPSNDVCDYTGEAVKPAVVVSNNSETKLVEKIDYNVYYSDSEITDGNYEAATAPVLPGLGYVYVVGLGSYSGTVSRTYSIKADLSKIVESETGDWTYGAIVSYKDDAKTLIDQAGIKTQFLTGKEIKPENIGLILFKKGGTIANNGYFTVSPSDYSWVYGSNDAIAYSQSGWVQAVGDSTYIAGAHTTSFDIELDTSLIDIYIDGVKYESSKEYPYQFTGAEIKPKFTTNYSNIVVDDSRTEYSRADGTAITDSDFFVKKGEIAARLYLKVENTDAKIDDKYFDVKYTITGRKLADCTLVMASSQRYTGKQIKPAFTIFIQNSTGQYPLTEGTDYSVAYGTNIAKTGSITLTALPTSDVVVGEKTGTFKINLGTVGGLTATASGDSITAKWVNDIYSDGAVVIVEKVTTASDGIAVYTEVKNQKFDYSTTTHTFTGLESNTNYRVKAYAYENNNNITSTPSFRAVSTGIGGTEFEISNAVAGRLTLTWPTEGEVKIYRIFRGTEADKSSCRMIASYPASTGAFTNSSLTSGQTYYYYLKGYIINSQGVLEQFSESELISETVK